MVGGYPLEELVEYETRQVRSDERRELVGEIEEFLGRFHDYLLRANCDGEVYSHAVEIGKTALMEKFSDFSDEL